MSSRSKKRTLAIILGGGRGSRLYPLTRLRAKPAVPLGGKYRLIDVPISNCLNNGLNKMFVLTQFESASLHQHLRSSYQFDRFGGGFVEVLAAQQRYDNDDWYQGTADAVRQNLDQFGDKWDELLILSGDQLYRMDFQHLLRYHRETDADMTIAALAVDPETATSCGILNVNESGRVLDFLEKPPLEDLKGRETSPALFDSFNIDSPGKPYLASMGIYVFNRDVLHEELTSHHHIDFGHHLFPAAMNRRKIQAYAFDGYWEDIGTVKSFHEANLAMAKANPEFSFRDEGGLIYTRPRTLPGSIAARLNINDSIIADGCEIEDLTMEQSVLGIRSIIGKNVRLTRTLVMGADYYESERQIGENKKTGTPNLGIGDNVEIEDAIVDKNVRIGSDVVIKNPDRVEPSESSFYTVRDGVICIFKGAVIPSGTRIGV